MIDNDSFLAVRILDSFGELSLYFLDAMNSLKTQSTNGLTRNLTDVFQFLRQNSLQNRRCVNIGAGIDSNDDRIALLDDSERGTAVSFRSGNTYTPSWVNVLDEVNFELTKLVYFDIFNE